MYRNEASSLGKFAKCFGTLVEISVRICTSFVPLRALK